MNRNDTRSLVFEYIPINSALNILYVVHKIMQWHFFYRSFRMLDCSQHLQIRDMGADFPFWYSSLYLPLYFVCFRKSLYPLMWSLPTQPAAFRCWPWSYTYVCVIQPSLVISRCTHQQYQLVYLHYVCQKNLLSKMNSTWFYMLTS